MKITRSFLPIFMGLAFVCSVLLLLSPQITHADPAMLIQTTVEDFNRGSFYRTGMTRDDDGEITLLRSGIAGEWLTNINATGSCRAMDTRRSSATIASMSLEGAPVTLITINSVCPDQHPDPQPEQLDHIERGPADQYLHVHIG